MQDSQTDPDNSRRLRVDEQYITFRPSPNFKNMKKFLKSKVDYLESLSQSPPNGSSEQTTPNAAESPPRNSKLMDKEEQPSPAKPVVHPPLPLEPPPPDILPVMPVPIKHEVIDNEYPEQVTGTESPDLSTTESEESSLRVIPEEQETNTVERPKVTVCRDFIRGTCIRVGCKFAHQRDLSQLSGVYTFCRNYQNAFCSLPICKYVHATVFEEQEFYRTGVLPAHAQYHLKKAQSFYMLPPPPPPPPPPREETQRPPHSPEVLNPVTLHCSNPADKPLISCVPVSKLESKPAENDFRHVLQAITTPQKRDWNSIDPFTSPPRELDNNELHPKKCKHCDSMDIRLQYNREKSENMKSNNEDLQLKSNILFKKREKLFTVLLTVIKEQAGSVTGYNKLKSKLSMCGEKEKELLLQVMDHNIPQVYNIM